MRNADKLADEKIQRFYEIDEAFDDSNFSNINNDNKGKKDTKRELTEDELYRSISKLTEIYDTCDIKIGRGGIQHNVTFVRRYFYEEKNGVIRGIYADLEKKIGLDLRLKETDSPKEKFDKLKLLKQICVAEKLGIYPAGGIFKEYPEISGTIPIIDIIKNPKLKNKYNDYGDDSLYADEFEIIYDNVRSQVPNAEEIEKELYAIHDQWKFILNLSFHDAALSSYFVDKDKSMKAQRDLVKKIPIEFDGFLSKEENAGVMERFFIMLVTTKIRAEINDYCKIVFSYSFDEKNASDNENSLLALFNTDKVLDKEFLKSYAMSEFFKIELSSQEFIEMMQYGSDTDKIRIWQLVFMKEHVSIPDGKILKSRAFINTTKRIEYVARFWKKAETRKNFKMPVDNWCVLFRELMYIELKNDEISTYNQKGESVTRKLSAIVKSLNPERNVAYRYPESEDTGNKKRKPRTERDNRQESHSNMALRNRIRNRFLLLYSSPEIVDCRNEIERHILSMEQKILSYQTMEKIREADRTMRFPAAMCSVGNELIEYYKKILNTNLWIETCETEGNNAKKLIEWKSNWSSSWTAEETVMLDSQIKRWMDRGEYWLYDIQFSDEKVKRYFISALYLAGIEESESTTEYVQTTEHMVNEVFYSCMNDPECDSDTKDYAFRKYLNFMYYKNLQMDYTFTMHHKDKVIMIDQCSFDKEIQAVLDIIE